MDLPGAPAVAALATFLREQLAERLGDIVDLGGSVLGRLDGARESQVLPAGSDATVVTAARQLATVIIGAAAPFASTSYSRARLIRQMHASGLLSDDETRTTRVALESGPSPRPVPGPASRPARESGGAPR